MTGTALPQMIGPLAMTLAILGLLFAVAHRVELRGLSARGAALAYPLSLAVYFSSWTFYGGVGTAATDGWPYLAIYLGPALVFLLLPRFLGRLLRRTADVRATSVSDFLARCYGSDRGVAAVVATTALVASIPYIGLQLRAVAASFGLLAGVAASPLIAGGVAVLLAAFAIAFGARRLVVAGRNSGVIASIAVESLIKLFAFMVLGLFAFLAVSEAPPALRDASIIALSDQFAGAPGGSFVVQTLLAGIAIICLPRQFMVTFVEAPQRDSVERARGPFILYLALVSLMVLPLVLAGMSLLPAGTPPDLFVLALPLAEGRELLALLAFAGGLSAATAMVIAETLALSTMISNDLAAPLFLRSARARAASDLSVTMRGIRRVAIAAILAAAFLYDQVAGSGPRLANFGLIAFAGVAQFFPALVATMAFGLSNARAARAAMLAGALVWGYTLFLPSIGGEAFLSAARQASGGVLDPVALFGWTAGDPLTHGALWSLGVNIIVLLLLAAVGSARAHGSAAAPGAQALRQDDVAVLRALAARFVGDAEAAAAFEAATGPTEAARVAERLIADVIGAPSARMIISSALAGETMAVADVVRLLDQSGQSVQFSRALLSATLETIDSGVSVVDQNLRLVAWNRRYLELFNYPPGMVEMGRPIAELIRHNALRGECGPGEVEAHIERRLWHLKRGRPHSFERHRPDGRWIKTVGSPMPGGGYVMSFADITAEKAREAELARRVAERTADLAAANRALRAETARAEAATRDKTRFLAAASHDLQQPLHAARLFCEAIQAEGDDAAAGLAGHAARAIASAESLLKTLLDVARLDAGGIQPVPTRFDAAVLVDELAAEFGVMAAAKGLRFRALAADAELVTDRGLLRSVLQNLLSNAVRYTASGAVLLTARRRAGRLVFAVADSGPGIAPADQKRIFQEFERLEETAGQPGAGLGLALAQRISRLLGADLTLDSVPGRGSRFSLSLPLPPAEAAVGTDSRRATDAQTA
ncbi:MAG: PAS-domain containing protein [Sphingomonadaceae bacterium]